jgi:hypothetical protein
MLIVSEPWIFFYFCSIMAFFFSLNIVFSVGIFFFFVVFVGGILCVYLTHLLRSSLVLFILGVLGSWEFPWRAGSYFFCVGLACVESWSGTIYLSFSLGGWRGRTGFSSLGLC